MKILGIGNAIVDVICKVNNEFITQNNLTKSTMKLVDEAEFKKLLSSLKIKETIAEGAIFSKAVKEGFDLIRKQLYYLLEKQGVTKIEALDQVFDPNLHQAVMQETREGVESNRVLEVMQEGYLYHERVLRAAMVLVSN